VSAPDHAAGRALVLLHGLGRTRWAMQPLAREGERRGYRVLNLGYPSRSGDVATHAERVAEHIVRALPEGPLYVVTHSLGGIVLRAAVARGHLPAARVARAVMLAPPNQGSELAEMLWHHPRVGALVRRTLGPAGAEVGVGPDAIVAALPAVPFELGVIAGDRPLTPFLDVFPGPNDGKVSVARAAVPGMRELLVVPHTHTFLMRAPRVQAATFAFLEHGSFGDHARGA
jgi:hypothetical protein